MKTVDAQIRTFLEQLGEEHNLLKYIYNLPSGRFDPAQSSIYYSGPYWDTAEITAMIQSILLGKWISSGEKVREFEIAFSKRFNLQHSVMVNSGSSANLVMIGALKEVFGWIDGDEVIVSVVGFPTTIAPIVQHNLVPVFIDIEMETLNFDISKIEERITSRTRAIFISPVLGNPPDMDRLVQIAERHNLQLIMDNCDSLGSSWRGKLLTDYAVASSCSFYPAHHITTGEGGMVSANRKDLIDTARSLAWWGRDCYCVGAANLLPNGTCGKRFSKWLPQYDDVIDHKYIFTNLGYNLKPLDFQGAVGLVQLGKFDEIHAKRRTHKERIQRLIEQYLIGVRVAMELPHAETSWFGVPLICGDKGLKRELVAFLEQHRIQTRNYFAGNILLHPAYARLDDYRRYPNANRVLDEVFFIGCAPHYTEEIFTYLAAVLKTWPEHQGTGENRV